jgi:hypothetical protein
MKIVVGHKPDDENVKPGFETILSSGVTIA